MSTTLLCAVDFEQASRRAVDLARELAGPLGAELCLMHVYQLPVYTYPGLEPQILPDLMRDITLAAGKALEQLAAEVGVARTILREGDPAQSILEGAREVGATMIVMGTHGRRGLSRALVGSVAEKVVRESEIPVLTVRSPEGAAPEATQSRKA
jgi:nucleotide-binding universal stress UspA family protein